MKIAIAGASGLVGSALIPSLTADGANVTRLVRGAPKPGEIEWHPNHDQVQAHLLEGFDGIINLAGENIAAGRWTDEQKRKIRDSRVSGTHLLSEAIAKMEGKPEVFVCASATGIYGDRDDETLDEQSRRPRRQFEIWTTHCTRRRDALQDAHAVQDGHGRQSRIRQTIHQLGGDR